MYPAILLFLAASGAHAEKVRVFYMPEDKVFVMVANKTLCAKGESETACVRRITDRFCPKLDDGTCRASDIIEDSALPARSKRDKWRGQKGKGVSVDERVVTEQERQAAVEKELDSELAKPAPDPVKALILQRRLDKSKSGRK